MTGTATTSLPTSKDVRDLLTDLLGRDVDVAPADPWAPSDTERGAHAVYVDDRTGTAAVVCTDLALSAFAGAAIGLIPKGGAMACVEDRELSTMVGENLYEVLNVVAALFNAAGVPHVKLYAVHQPGELPPSDVSAIARALGRRLDLRVSVAGYGAGHLAVVLA
jgi:hypothetical protein